MGVIASQTTSVSIVYSTVCSGADQRKTSMVRVTGLGEENSAMTGEFPTQGASNEENVSIWWRHHVYTEARVSMGNHLLPNRFVQANTRPNVSRLV